jgi:hypothetical protein
MTYCRRIMWRVLMLCVLMLILVPSSQWVQRLYVAICIYRSSSNSCTFYDWSDMVKNQSYITIVDHTSQSTVEVPTEPHFILSNHISSHFALGTFITIAGVVQSPAAIVCYRTYDDMFFISNRVHTILDNEITIDRRLSKEEKERLMVAGIRRAFAAGKNVVMFLDAHSPSVPIRTLNRVVLNYFPEYAKQLVHILEPSGVTNHFGYRRYPATYDIDDIYRERVTIIESM